jgi:hypothetical protein
MTPVQQRRLKIRFPQVFRCLDLYRVVQGSPLGERDSDCGTACVVVLDAAR